MTISSDATKVTSALAAISDQAASGYLGRYYGLGEWQGREYTGSLFDTFLVTDTNKLTADDLVAVSCLSKTYPHGLRRKS
jgi:hypothetical protein